MRGRERHRAAEMLRQPIHKSTRNRLIALLAILMVGGYLFLPRLAAAADPYSSISPESQDGRDIQLLYKIIFWIALFVFIGVQGAIVFTVMKYRRRHEEDERPQQMIL